MNKLETNQEEPTHTGVALSAERVAKNVRQLIRQMVADKAAVIVEAVQLGPVSRLSVEVGRTDMGKIIGRQGIMFHALTRYVREIAPDMVLVIAEPTDGCSAEKVSVGQYWETAWLDEFLGWSQGRRTKVDWQLNGAEGRCVARLPHGRGMDPSLKEALRMILHAIGKQSGTEIVPHFD
jgi:predicted RNA-binding protein YlqC (UPF0109 family)